MRFLLFLAALAAAAPAGAHGVPILVDDRDGQLVLRGGVQAGVLAFDGFEAFADTPAIGVSHPALGPPTGTRIGLDTLGGLLYWDGSQIADAEATLSILPPLRDSEGNVVNSPVDQYDIHADSAAQSGLLWGEYPGVATWEADGEYLLSLSDHSEPASGLYGVPVRVVDQTDSLEPSDPFILPFLLGSLPTSAFDAGLAAFDTTLGLLAEPVPGDYDHDGEVNAQDYATWRAAVGSSVRPGDGADGNADGLVNTADYAIWRAAYGEAGAEPSTQAAGLALPVPEPAAAALSLLACFASSFTRN